MPVFSPQPYLIFSEAGYMKQDWFLLHPASRFQLRFLYSSVPVVFDHFLSENSPS